jgi:Flp pilus assembly protein TadG
MKPVMTRQGKRRDCRGVAVVEFAMVLPIMLVLMFGIVELGRAVLTRQVMLNVSREAANLASRGTTMNDAIAAVQMSAAPLDLPARGYVILTEVRRDGNNALRIYQQRALGATPEASRVGVGVGSLASLPATPTPIPPPGFNLFVAEVFYHSDPITPLGNLLNSAIGDVYYDIAYF